MIGKTGAIWCCLILVLLWTLSFVCISNHWRIQTDILALLPPNDHDVVVHTLRRVVSEHLGRTTLFLVSHAQPETAREATRQLGTMLEASGVFSDVQWEYSRQPQAFFDLYFPFRYRFISPTLRHYLEHNDGYTRLIDRVKGALYQPTSSLVTRFLDDDPLLFFPELMKDWQQHATQLRVDDGILGTRVDGTYHALITAKLAFNPFETQTQMQLEDSWRTWVSTLHRLFPDLTLTYTSVARFAASTRRQMQRDIFVISLGSLLGTTILMVATFRSMKYFFIALLPLAAGLWSAAGVTLCLFGELHAFTLAFGASLIGVCDDYSFHYFAHHRVSPQWQSQRAMQKLLPALSLGALTTVLSYAGLGLTPLVGLQQIAVFASCGILVSFLTVVFAFPLLLREPHPQAHALPLLYVSLQQAATLLSRFKTLLGCLLLAVLALCLKGMFALHIDDSPRALSVPPADLVVQDRVIRHMMGLSPSQRYLIVEGRTTEETLQQLEDFHQAIQPETAQYGVEWGPVLTSFVPSIRRQREDTQAVKSLLAYKRDIARELEGLGFSTRSIAGLFQQLEADTDVLLLPEAWLRHEASIGLRNLWLGETSRGAAVLVPLRRLHDVAKFHQTLSAFPGIRYVDQMVDFTRILQRYRKRAMLLVGAAYLVIFALLIQRYRVNSFAIMLPPCLASFITIGLLGLLGHAFTLMHCLALLLILGMGIDYTIFLTESSSSDEPTTLLALTLSSLTTALSFGLLSFSSQAMLQAIGMTTLLGILWTWLLAPLATYRRPRS